MPDKPEKRCSRCGKPASQCLSLGMIFGPIASNGQCRVCNGQVGLGVEYEGPAIDLTGRTAPARGSAEHA